MSTVPDSSSGVLARMRSASGVLTRGVPQRWPTPGRVIGTALVLLGAAMVGASAVIHLHLWSLGYRHIHLIGPAFLAQGIGGLILAVILAAYRRLAVIAIGAAYLAGSIGALLLSASVGFLGLHDGLDVPWAAWSLTTELVGLVSLISVGAAIIRAD